jgi:hypothetical protein
MDYNYREEDLYTYETYLFYRQLKDLSKVGPLGLRREEIDTKINNLLTVYEIAHRNNGVSLPDVSDTTLWWYIETNRVAIMFGVGYESGPWWKCGQYGFKEIYDHFFIDLLLQMRIPAVHKLVIEFRSSIPIHNLADINHL